MDFLIATGYCPVQQRDTPKRCIIICTKRGPIGVITVWENKIT